MKLITLGNKEFKREILQDTGIIDDTEFSNVRFNLIKYLLIEEIIDYSPGSGINGVDPFRKRLPISALDALKMEASKYKGMVLS